MRKRGRERGRRGGRYKKGAGKRRRGSREEGGRSE